MVTDVVCKLAPATGVKVKITWVTARVVSKPSRVTVKPVLLVVAVTLVIEGAAGAITMVLVGGGVGVMS